MNNVWTSHYAFFFRMWTGLRLKSLFSSITNSTLSLAFYMIMTIITLITYSSASPSVRVAACFDICVPVENYQYGRTHIFAQFIHWDTAEHKPDEQVLGMWCRWWWCVGVVRGEGSSKHQTQKQCFIKWGGIWICKTTSVLVPPIWKLYIICG